MRSYTVSSTVSQCLSVPVTQCLSVPVTQCLSVPVTQCLSVPDEVVHCVFYCVSHYVNVNL